MRLYEKYKAGKYVKNDLPWTTLSSENDVGCSYVCVPYIALDTLWSISGAALTFPEFCCRSVGRGGDSRRKLTKKHLLNGAYLAFGV